MLIDTDYGFGLNGSVNDNRLQMARYPTSPAPNHNSEIFDALLDNPVFKNYFINRYADLMNTVYLPTNVENVMKQFKDSMAFDMVAHFAKWGSDTTAWNGRIENMMNFAIQRPAITRNFIRDEFNLTSDVLLTINTLPVGSGRIEISTVTPSVIHGQEYISMEIRLQLQRYQNRDLHSTIGHQVLFLQVITIKESHIILLQTIIL
jgi:hypothetical protein